MKQINKLKSVITLIILIIVFTGCAAKPVERNLEDFLGIAWGQNVSTALSILAKNKFEIMNWSDSLIRAEGTFMNEDVYILLLFDDDKFNLGNIKLKKEANLSLYRQLNTLYTEKYGKPNFTDRGRSRKEIQMTIWNFDNYKTIITAFYPDLKLSDITYTDGKITLNKN